MGRYLTLALLLISTATPAICFSSGAPRAACETLAPNATAHGADPQTTDIPYVLNLSAFYDPTLDRMVYTPNTVYTSKFSKINILNTIKVELGKDTLLCYSAF